MHTTAGRIYIHAGELSCHHHLRMQRVGVFLRPILHHRDQIDVFFLLFLPPVFLVQPIPFIFPHVRLFPPINYSSVSLSRFPKIFLYIFFSFSFSHSCFCADFHLFFHIENQNTVPFILNTNQEFYKLNFLHLFIQDCNYVFFVHFSCSIFRSFTGKL